MSNRTASTQIQAVGKRQYTHHKKSCVRWLCLSRPVNHFSTQQSKLVVF